MSSTLDLEIRQPVKEEGLAVAQLIKRCPPLDNNSSYCNFLQCTHFAETSVAALLKSPNNSDDNLVGFISGYRIPNQPNTLFVWQVAVDERARGCGLAKRMLTHLLSRPNCNGIQYLETTISPDNEASWALFNSLAKQLETQLNDETWLDSERHFQGQHDSETLVRIGPFSPSYSP